MTFFNATVFTGLPQIITNKVHTYNNRSTVQLELLQANNSSLVVSIIFSTCSTLLLSSNRSMVSDCVKQ